MLGARTVQSKRSVPGAHIHTLDTALIMVADTISGYIQPKLS